MNNSPEKSGDREATRARLVAVYNRLLLDTDTARPKVAELIAEAGVARSTFYDHFDGIEALHDESLSMLLGQFADVLAGKGDRDWLVHLLAHVWENRARGREMMSGEQGERAEALLARLLEQRLEDEPDARLHAILIAGMTISAISGWLRGQVAASPERLAERVTNSAAAILAPAET